MADHSFFQNSQCEYFPCHKVTDKENFNCLFCYCPLYALGADCGGNFAYTKDGIKDCSNCTIPHRRGNYKLILEKMGQIIERTKKETKGEA